MSKLCRQHIYMFWKWANKIVHCPILKFSFIRHETQVSSKIRKLWFCQNSGFSNSYNWLEISRSQSQLSVELWILKIGPVILVRFSKFKVLRKAGTEIYAIYQNIRDWKIPEFRKNLMPVLYIHTPQTHTHISQCFHIEHNSQCFKYSLL